MTKYLRGNYVVNATIEAPTEDAGDATEAFERKALARLGGSICFVSKKGFLWKGDAPDGPGTTDRRPA
jgi:hypothetical protein